ncbi:hypothetical protein AB6A40_008946 [Gnathostoma spinigerum]|uniref:Uncharacterized protein n=1 Tax=Gnathostoma spinigerum TaxID=75299 RepID=A0ABD6EZU2_9BILA
MTSLLASFFLLLVGCLLWCAFRQRLSKKRTKSAKGKFVDTSHRIFNEQRVQKTRLYHASAALCMVQDDPNEFSPLKTNGSENRVSPASSLKDFPFSRSGRTVPNLYGAGDDFSENEGNMGDGTITDGCIGPKYGGSASQFHDISFYTNSPAQYYSLEEVQAALPSPHQVSQISQIYSSELTTGKSALAGTTSSFVDSSSTIGAAVICGATSTLRPISQSPLTDSAENEVNGFSGGSSRNSEVSSNDGFFMHTFKSNTSSVRNFTDGGSTLDRRLTPPYPDREESRETTPIAGGTCGTSDFGGGSQCPAEPYAFIGTATTTSSISDCRTLFSTVD